MAKHSVSVNLELTDNFSAGMAAGRDAAMSMRHEWVLRTATWEPHDWQEW